MAEGGIPGSKPFDPRGGKEGTDRPGNQNGADGKNDGAQPHSDAPQQTPQQVQQGATEQFHKDLQPPIAQKPSVATTEGAAPSGSAQSQPGKEAIAMSPAGKQFSPEVKPASPETKAANSPVSSDKAVSSSSPKSSDTARTDVSNASQVLPNASLENLQPTQKKTYSETGSHLDSGKVQDKSASTTADRPGHKADPRQNEPLGGDARQNKDSQPPPVTKTQDNSSQNQNHKITNQENKSESKSGSITPPVIIPADAHQTQKNQNPASPTHQQETALVKPLQDSVPKIQDAKNLPTDTPKQNLNDGKPGPEVAQGKNTDSPRSSPAAGELGSKNSADKEPIAREQQQVKEAGSASKSDVASGEQATKEAPHNAEPPAPSKAIHADTADTLPTDKHVFIDKSKHSQIDGTKDTATGTRPGEAYTGNRDGKQEPPGKETITNELTHKPESRTDTRMTDVAVGGSLGAGLDSRSGRDDLKAKDKSQPKEVGEVFKTLDGKPVRLDLTNKETCKQLLDLINQIETNKFKQLDQTGRERLNLLLEVRTAALQQFKEILTAFVTKDVPVDSRAGLLLQDKLEPGSAERSKQQVDRIMELERSNSSFKQIVSRVSEAFDQFLRVFSAPTKEPAKEFPDAQGLVNQLTESDDDPMRPEVREFVITMKEILPRDIGSFDVVDVAAEEVQDVDDTSAVTNSTTVDPSGHSREEYLVQDKDTPQSIALKCFNNEELWRLILKINKPEATYSDINDKIRNRDFLAGDLIHLPTYTERQKFLKPKGVPHESS